MLNYGCVYHLQYIMNDTPANIFAVAFHHDLFDSSVISILGVSPYFQKNTPADTVC